MKPKRLFLIDGYAIAYRGYFAFIRRPLTNSRGENTSAVFVFAQTLLKILQEERPDYIAVALDTKEPTFRHKQYAPYKATREKMPDDMIPQIGRIQQLIEAMSIPVVQVPGFEADDVMGTLAREAEREGVETYLVTGDKDFMQLVSDRVKIYRTHSATKEVEILDAAAVKEKFGVAPEQVTDVLGLMGDASDNVPGIPKVGEKTAVKLIQEFGSLEKVLSHPEKAKGEALQKNLREFKDQAMLSKHLVTIDTHVDLKLKLPDLKAAAPDMTKIQALFQELEFLTLLESFSKQAPAAPRTVPVDKKYHAVLSDEEWRHFLEEAQKQKRIVVDTETTSVDPLQAELVGLSFSWKAGEAFYLPVMGALGVELAKLEKLRGLLENSQIEKVGQNIKYDMLVLSQHGIELAGIVFDTMVAAYLLNPGRRQNNLDALALEYLHVAKTPTTDLIGTGKKQITMREVPLEKITQYACEDADLTWRLQEMLAPLLKENELEPLFTDVEMPLVEVLYAMEKTGVGLDVPFLNKMSKQLEERIGELEKEIYAEADETFNINSNQQLGKILFEKLRLHEKAGKKRAKKTKTGYATDVGALEDYADQPIVQRLMEYRQMAKLKNTYVDALPALVNPKTGRVHTSFNQTVTATGRLSSSDPNLQNIPFRTDLGREIRRAFIPRDAQHVLLSADYSQIELRLMAALSRDESLLRAFRNDEDIHRSTASVIFAVHKEEVTPQMRNRAKSINFGILYGMGAYGLAQDAGISPEEAQAFIDAYFMKYPGVKIFIDETIESAHKLGYVKTLLGRTRYLPELKSDNARVVNFAENAAINTPLQGTAADLIKVAMVELHREIRKKGLKTRMILQVHDELLFEAPREEVEEIKPLIQSRMEGALKVDVPIKVEVRTGKNWFEAHP